MTIVPGQAIRVEVLVREGCPNRRMALHVIEQAVASSGVAIDLLVVDVRSKAQAKSWRFLGSPSVRVEGIDVEPGAHARTDFAFGDRIYRCGLGGLQGWPDESWIRSALLVSTAQSPSNGNGSA